MATCTVIEVDLPKYELRLTSKEAAVLLDVFNSVGGPVGDTPRGKIDGIMNALTASGASRANHDKEGKIYFAIP